MTARESVQASETARLLAIKGQDDERIARDKQEAAAREAAARAQADEAARQKAVADDQAADAAGRAAESARQAEAESRRAAEEKAAAQTARASEEAARLRAEQARLSAAEQQRQAEQARLIAEQKAQEAERLRMQAEQAQQQLRQQLLAQFNLILETRDTARGLIVNMSDVLFDFNKYTLRPAAREKLAKISGIILSHPGLRLEVVVSGDIIGTPIGAAKSTR